MISSGFEDNRKIIYTTFEDCRTIRNGNKANELFLERNARSITPVTGEKIQTFKQIKVKIDVKMPSIYREKREKNYFKGNSFTKSKGIMPKVIPKKHSVQLYCPKKTEILLKLNNQHEIRPKVVGELKHRQLSYGNYTKKNIYSVLLGFLIKVQVDFVPLYQAIDVHRKGKIEFDDFEVFIGKNYHGLEPFACFEKLMQLNSFFTDEKFVLKRNFLAICAGLTYKKPPEKDYKSIFLTISQELLILTMENYVKAFSELTDKRCLEMSKLLLIKSFKDKKAYKSLQTVFSEPVDLQRFIHCYPFFKWLSD